MSLGDKGTDGAMEVFGISCELTHWRAEVGRLEGALEKLNVKLHKAEADNKALRAENEHLCSEIDGERQYAESVCADRVHLREKFAERGRLVQRLRWLWVNEWDKHAKATLKVAEFARQSARMWRVNEGLEEASDKFLELYVGQMKKRERAERHIRELKAQAKALKDKAESGILAAIQRLETAAEESCNGSCYEYERDGVVEAVSDEADRIRAELEAGK